MQKGRLLASPLKLPGLTACDLPVLPVLIRLPVYPTTRLLTVGLHLRIDSRLEADRHLDVLIDGVARCGGPASLE